MNDHLPATPRWLEAGVLVVLMILFAHFADWNYRSHDGRLADNVPPFQNEIVDGTAPAPYVYRQAVPQLRAALGAMLPPGHAAVVVDLAFAALAGVCGFALGSFAFGPRRRVLGALLVALAVVTVYPNDKPESVAMVALPLLATVLALNRRHLAAAGVVALSAPFRPELSLLFPVAWIISLRVAGPRSPEGGSRGSGLIAYAVALAVGVAYLALARFAWWPSARYPEGTQVVMLIENLTSPLRYPGLALVVMLGSLGGFWCLQALRTPRSKTSSLADNDREARLGVGLFIVLWSLADLGMGRTNEIRLAMPLVALCLALALGRWTPSIEEARSKADGHS